MIDVAVSMELLTRLGVGFRWQDIARDLRVSPRTLRRSLQRVGEAFQSEIRDFRALVVAVEARGG